MGAGVIPYCFHRGELLFLFHRTFSGRRAGFLVDFGGGSREHENYRQTAVRELIEETETMLFDDQPGQGVRTAQRIMAQTPRVDALFERTLSAYPNSWCRRVPGNKIPPKDWVSFFIDIGYRDVEPLNQAWAHDDNRRFRKRRHLTWIPQQALTRIYREQPHRLWKRVRQLQGAPELIQAIAGRLP